MEDGMNNGYYWIQHAGSIQVAYFSNEIFEDLETGRMVPGVWLLTRGDDLCHNGEVEVISGPLIPPKDGS